ncbi:M56 family metallopeptidase [Streptomyces peucetius]|uniref:M56 family metallopeptidase n=1 Tax=Streptomyces peucetius TaxID=1950 RepID=A0ABY6I1E6_STRPE|nr:M56 family metallopeptidase [Streptomyces peucetius]UYQ60594.1 M56 family metallopeptidase [Streptomyces peucetius]
MLAILAGAVLPLPLARSRWSHQAPRLAIATWTVLAGVFTVASALTVLQLLLPYRSSHRLADGLEDCLPWTPRGCAAPGAGSLVPADFLAALGATAVLLLPVALFLRQAIHARRRRSRHAELLHFIGRTESRLGATVLDHPTPAIYCLPGRTSRVVVSTGALRVLTGAQLDAVLHHERAHITGRHHLLTVGAQAAAHIFPALPLFRHIQDAVPLLLEMAADDRALRRCSREALATALYAMAAGQAPQPAMAAGGPSAVLRVRRILTPEAGHPVLQGLLTTAAAIGAVTPLVMACCSIPG